MPALLLAPALALLVLAAHFARSASWLTAAACVCVAALVALRRAWVPPLVQCALAAGCAVWAWTAFEFVQQRIAMGRPWGRLALILGTVALLTGASALVFRVARVRRRYRDR